MAKHLADDEPGDLQGIWAHTKGLEQQVNGVAQEVKNQANRLDRFATTMTDKLDQLTRAVTMQAAQPQFSVMSVLGIVSLCVGLLGSGAASIIFISSAMSAAPIARIETKMESDREHMRRLEKLIERMTDQRIASAK